MTRGRIKADEIKEVMENRKRERASERKRARERERGRERERERARERERERERERARESKNKEREKIWRLYIFELVRSIIDDKQYSLEIKNGILNICFYLKFFFIISRLIQRY